MQRAASHEGNLRLAGVTSEGAVEELLCPTHKTLAVARHPMWFHAIAEPPHAPHHDENDHKPYVFHSYSIADGAPAGASGLKSGATLGGVGFDCFRARMGLVMLLADSFEDPARARVIYMAAGGLVLIAILVIAGTVWWWRSAAVEHSSLGPLEVMGTRSWSKGDFSDRRNRLDSVRPDGAEPGDTSLIVTDPVDLLETDRTRPLDFDDLVGSAEDDDWKSDEPVVTRGRAPMDPLLRPKSSDY